jgi:hypothetical protein
MKKTANSLPPIQHHLQMTLTIPSDKFHSPSLSDFGVEFLQDKSVLIRRGTELRKHIGVTSIKTVANIIKTEQ